MKHIKTFESYSSLNEEFLGLGKIYDKLKSAISSWSDRRTKSVAEKFAKLIDDKKDDPKFKEALEKVRQEASKLSSVDKEKIMELSKGNIPEGAPISESLNESTESFINKILKRLGLTAGSFGLIMAIWTCLKITGAVAGSTVFGIHIGLAIGVFTGLMAAGGLVSGIGYARSASESEKEDSEAAFKRSKKFYGK